MSAITLFSLPVELLTIIFEHVLGRFPRISQFYGQRAILLSCSRLIRKIVCDRHHFWRYLTVQRAEIEAVVLSTEGVAPVIPPSLLLSIEHARGPVSLSIDTRDSVNTHANASDVEMGQKLDVVVEEIFVAHKSRLISLKVDEGTLLGCGVHIMRAIRAHQPHRLESLKVATGNDSFGEWEEETTLDDEGCPTAVLDDSSAHSQAPIPALRSLEMQGVMNEYDDENMSGNIWDVATLAEAAFRDMDPTPPSLTFLRALLDKNPRLGRLTLHDAFDDKHYPIPKVFAGVQELDIGVKYSHDRARAFMNSVEFPDLRHLTLTAKGSGLVFPSPTFINTANTAFPLNELISLHLRDIHSQANINPCLFDGLKRLRMSGTTLRQTKGVLPFKCGMNQLRPSPVDKKKHLPFPILETLEMEVIMFPESWDADWETEVKRALSLISGRLRSYLRHEEIPRTLKTARILFRGIQSSYDAPTADPEVSSPLLPFVGASLCELLKRAKVRAAEDIPFTIECVFVDEDENWMEVVDLKALAFKKNAASSG